MNWLFAHDNRFLKADDGQVYSEVAFSYSNWERYLAHVDNLTILARMEKLGGLDKNTINLSSGPCVTFQKVEDPYGIRTLTPFPIGYKTVLEAVKKTDGVIARLPSEIGYMALKAARKTNTPYCIEVVGDGYQTMATYGNWKGKLYAPIAERKMKRNIASSHHTLYITENHLQERYPPVGYSVSCSNVEIPNIEEKTVSQRQVKIKSDRKRLHIGMNGSLSSPYKGFESTFLALAKIKSELPPFEFRILGRGPKERWQALAKELDLEKNVVFCGTLPNKEVCTWLDDIDIFLMPSKTEGQGRALIEALSRGCSCLGSNVGGIPELLEPEQLHESGDVATFANQIKELATNIEKQLLYAERGIERVKPFQSEILQNTRQEFFHRFKEAIEMRN
ncbi:glycosyltransferase family 4 protein [Listeria booriae]|uniref:Glycosyltransferase family 4 protein n=1 Tax=Listeria booriae TaxID=1552123 RepID=A0A7X1DJ75_9LIST|nr:glycosyltransferase family 4 protein [Listeria booriae]MBC2309703.1 glycosyltransferase family 4 protein [Listeria booriae]